MPSRPTRKPNSKVSRLGYLFPKMPGRHRGPRIATQSPLRLALYGHPDAGGYWEQHCHASLLKCGFLPVQDWPSVYWHDTSRVLLLVYVDDFKMAGPPSAVACAWTRIRQELLIGDPCPVTVFLGCTQCEHKVSDSENREYRALENNMEDFLKSCLSPSSRS